MAERPLRIAQEDRERIVRAFEGPEQDCLVVADTLGVNRSTARGIVARFIWENRVDERPRGGRNNVKVNADAAVSRSNSRRESNVDFKSYQSKIKRGPDRPHVQVGTVAKHLDGMLYTLKLAPTVPADRNRADVIQRRNEYAHWFLEETNLNHTVFIDECGFSIWTLRSQWRSQQGNRAYRQVCGQKGKNITICLAISPLFGLIYHKIQLGGMTGALFNEFLENTNEHLDEHETHYLITLHFWIQLSKLSVAWKRVSRLTSHVLCSRIRWMTEMRHEMLKFPWGNIASVFWSQLLRGTCVALVSKSVLPGSDWCSPTCQDAWPENIFKQGWTEHELFVWVFHALCHCSTYTWVQILWSNVHVSNIVQ